ncbi:MAG TPA: hypothetical protein VG675_15045 [Bryobacteraceae bacterium]|nr:hypothetical protein [Bryobacteraceae bacterium]
MRFLIPVAICCLLAGSASAQRGGGMRGGGFSGGGGAHFGGFGGSRGGFGGGFAGSRGFGGFRGGFRGGFIGFNRGFRGFRSINTFNTFGFGFVGFPTYWPGYYGGYYPYSYPFYGAGYYGGDYAYPVQQSPNVTVVYPAPAVAPAPTTINIQTAHPVDHQYDQYGQEISPSGGNSGGNASPIYLIAFKDHVIRAVSAYWVDGNTLHYVSLQHQEQQVPLATVDRDFSIQLNRERSVPFQLPAQ